MRKIYLLLLTLLCAVGAWADALTAVNQIQDGHIYTFKTVRNAITWDGTSANCVGAALDANNVNHQFVAVKWEGHDDRFYFFNVGAQKFMSQSGSNAALTEKPNGYWKVKTGGNATYPLMIDAESGSHFNFGGSGQISVDGWATADEGNRFQITEVGTANSATMTAINAAIVAAAKDQGAYFTENDTRVGFYTKDDVSLLNDAITYYELSPSESDLETIKGEYYRLLTSGAKVTLAADEIFTLQCVDTGRGYMIYSTVDGKGSEDYPNVAGSTWAWDPELTDGGVHKEWAIVEVDGSKFIYNVDREGFLNAQNTVIKFNNFGYGVEVIDLKNGESAIKFTSNNQYVELSPGYELNESVRTIGSIGGGAKFYIVKTGASVTSELSTKMADYHTTAVWKEGQLKVLGYVGGYPKELREAINGITNNDEKSVFEGSHEKIKFTAGGYYFLKTAANQNTTDGYMTYDGTACKAFPLATGEALSSKHVWKFDAINGEVGYKLKSCNLDKYLKSVEANDGASTITSTYAQGYKYTFDDQGYAQFIVKDGNDKVIRTEGSSGNRNVNYWDGYNLTATWYVIPAELDITIGDAGYASAYYSFPVKPSTGLQAYAITSAEGESATLVANDDIPANQGAILKGEKGTTYKLTAREATSDWDGNKLTGTNEDAYVKGNAYVLAKDGDNVGLYKAKLNKNANGDAGDSHFKNNANKAYLPASELTSARFLTFNFDDNAETGINAVEIEETAPANAAIYDLSGRRVQSAKSGLYIINGKKVIK